MRAALLRRDQIVVEKVADPKPGPGDVVVKVLACGICGSDLHMGQHMHHIIENGKAAGVPTADFERAVNDGVVLGHEFVGEIVDFGPDTQRTLKTGQRVCSMPFVLKSGVPVLVGSNPETMGAYAEYMLLTEALLMPVDERVTDEAAAFVEPLGIAIHAVNKSGITPDHAAIVVGCGPIGLAIVAVLKARGIKHIVASDLSARRRELAGVMGATHIVNGASESVIAKTASVAPTAPVIVFENTGARGMLNRVVLEAPQNTTIVVTGIAPGSDSFMPLVAVGKELNFKFVIYYTPQEFAEALDMVRSGAVNCKPLITGKIGLNGVAQAFKDLADPERHAKIIIDPSIG
jgi:(R,R)-butanediol dehydrogenase / meso-butanediol dehydrogenase / diacetyl reductase